MKRDILCPPCSKPAGIKLDAPAFDVMEAMREDVRFVRGWALREMRCDACGAAIDTGDDCVARSIVVPPQQHIAWEHEYVEAVHPWPDDDA